MTECRMDDLVMDNCLSVVAFRLAAKPTQPPSQLRLVSKLRMRGDLTPLPLMLRYKAVFTYSARLSQSRRHEFGECQYAAENTKVAGIERLDGGGRGIIEGVGKRFLAESHSIDHRSYRQEHHPHGRQNRVVGGRYYKSRFRSVVHQNHAPLNDI